MSTWITYLIFHDGHSTFIILWSPEDEGAENKTEFSEDKTGEATSQSTVPELGPGIEEELAEFYEENPLYYDKSRSDVKNQKKKDCLLQEKLDSPNLTGECNYKYFIVYHLQFQWFIA